MPSASDDSIQAKVADTPIWVLRGWNSARHFAFYHPFPPIRIFTALYHMLPSHFLIPSVLYSTSRYVIVLGWHLSLSNVVILVATRMETRRLERETRAMDTRSIIGKIRDSSKRSSASLSIKNPCLARQTLWGRNGKEDGQLRGRRNIFYMNMTQLRPDSIGPITCSNLRRLCSKDVQSVALNHVI